MKTVTNKPPFLEIAKEGFELIFQAAPTDDGLAMKILKALYSAIYEDKEPSELNEYEYWVFRKIYSYSGKKVKAYEWTVSNPQIVNARKNKPN